MEQNEKAKRIAELYARGKELSGVLGKDPSGTVCITNSYIPQAGFFGGVEVFGEYKKKVLAILQEELDAVSAELAELTK